MKFDQREWVNEMVSTAVTGLIGGLVAILFAPDVPVGLTIACGGIIGLLTGVLNLPLRWLLNLRPQAPETNIGSDEESHRSVANAARELNSTVNGEANHEE